VKTGPPRIEKLHGMFVANVKASALGAPQSFLLQRAQPPR
jgi:hypothetical protein